MSEVWPFPPDDEITDSYNFLTDLMRARDAEKRIPVRNNPRRFVSFSHTLTDETYAMFKAIAERNSSFGEFDVPIWNDAFYIGDVSIAQNTFTFATSEYGFTGKCVIFSAYDDFEILQITTVNIGSIVTSTSTTKAYRGAFIIPTRVGIATAGFAVSRDGYNNYQASVIFKIIDDVPYGDNLDSDIYKAIPVIPYRPNRNVSLSEEILDDIQEIDNVSGLFVVDRKRDFTDFRQTVEFRSQDHSKIFNLREFIGYLIGRSEPFWLPSYFNEITLLSTALSVSMTARVKKVLNLSQYVGKFTYIELNSGIKIYSKITNAVDSSGEVLLTFEAETGQNIDPEDIFQFCFMEHVRSDTDEFQFVYSQGLACSLTFLVTRVSEI